MDDPNVEKKVWVKSNTAVSTDFSFKYKIKFIFFNTLFFLSCFIKFKALSPTFSTCLNLVHAKICSLSAIGKDNKCKYSW